MAFSVLGRVMKGPMRWISRALALAFLGAQIPGACRAQTSGSAMAPHATDGREWRFAVSGDSRNCGDVVMPAIAAAATRRRPLFYWHLGDYRKITDVDEDIQQQPEHRDKPLSLPTYEQIAWPDFIENQLMPFGKLPVYLALGNHEMADSKTRAELMAQFRPWFDAPGLRAQRLRDDSSDLEPRTYYHWIERGVDFIALDNATPDEFDAAQMAWFEKRMSADAVNPRIRTIVAGMHEALPESISANHSMDQSEESAVEAGRRVYADLLKAQNEDHKRVYVLASHSHYYMDGIFNTPYWRAHGGVLAGWIVGTAGAQRYALPPEKVDAKTAETNVYGFLLASVNGSGEIRFDFERVNEQDVPASVTGRYTARFVRWCFADNSTLPGANATWRATH
jgi:hypothetical protein